MCPVASAENANSGLSEIAVFGVPIPHVIVSATGWARRNSKQGKVATNLYKRGDVYWWRCMIAGTTYRKSTGMRDLQMAKRKASEFDAAIRAGQAGWVTTKVPTVGEWFDRYTERLDGLTLRRHVALLRHARELWGSRPIDSIRHTDCAAYVAKRMYEATSAPGTIWLEGMRLTAVFGLAVQDEILTRNPWKRIRLPQPPKRTRVLSAEEEAKLRAAIPEQDAWIARLLTVVLGTGLRRQEIMGLRPRHIRNGVIYVPPELAKGKKARSVPVRAPVMEALRGQVGWERENATTGLLEALPGMSDVRFFPLSEGYALSRIRKLCEDVGIPRLTLHDLRRTFATRAATGELTGVSMPLLHLTRIMGHSSPTITAKYYIYLQENELIKQMQNQAPITMDGPGPTLVQPPAAEPEKV